MNKKTLGKRIEENAAAHPDRVWLRERRDDVFTEYSWQQGLDQINAAGTWFENKFGRGTNIALLSKNRPHWFMADMAIIRSGNVSVPLFTTLSGEHAEYILDFAEVRALVLGETANWDAVNDVLPAGTEIITLPGVECERPHIRWEEIFEACAGQSPGHVETYDDTISIVFTSGTTGAPKGAIQSHSTFLDSMIRTQIKTDLPEQCRAFSYLPLAHIAERFLVESMSVILASEVTFNESLETLLRDLNEARPHYLFGAPRVWEQLQLGTIASFGSLENYQEAFAADSENIAAAIREKLGLQDALYLVTGAAPAPPSLIDWYWEIGLPLTEGYGQTEAMGLIGATKDENRRGSIGKAVDLVELKIGDDDELLVKADGLSPGYYKHPQKTAELWRDGWLHTGDKARIDNDGYVFLKGRVKDYFKTIHGKFVAPAPMESDFAACPHVEQLCLLGLGYSKTVMVCVLTGAAANGEVNDVESDLLAKAEEINAAAADHARIGALIVTREPWTIDNGVLTPTLKVRRNEVDRKFGAQAEALARRAAESHSILLENA